MSLHRLDPRPHAAGIEHALADRSPPSRAGSSARERRPSAARTRRPRRAPRPARGPASRGRRALRPRARIERGAGVVGGRHRQPDQAAGPVVEPLCAAGVDRARDFGAAARRGRDAPERPRVAPTGRERRHVAHGAPERRASSSSSSTSPAAERLHQRDQRCAAMRDRRRDAFEPQRRRGARLAARPSKSRRQPAPADAPRRTHRRPSPWPPPSPRRPPRRRGRATITVASVSGPGSTLDRDVGHRRERAPGAGHQLAAGRSR